MQFFSNDFGNKKVDTDIRDSLREKRYVKLSNYAGCSLNIVFYLLSNAVIFLNSVSSGAALVFDLPSGGPSMKSGVHTLTPEEAIKASVQNI